MIEAFVNGILTMVGVVFFVLSQVLLYKCGNADCDKKAIFGDGYAVSMFFGLSLIIGGIGDIILQIYG